MLQGKRRSKGCLEAATEFAGLFQGAMMLLSARRSGNSFLIITYIMALDNCIDLDLLDNNILFILTG